MASLPSFVFIPGAWHKPACYDKIIKLLEEHHKFNCVSVTLPSTSGDREKGFKDDLDAARAAISGEIAQGRDVVVVAHSYGGMVGNSSVKGFTRPKGESSSAKGFVVGLILIASGFTFTGMSFMDPFFGQPPPMWRVNKETGFAEIVLSPREFFYHDLSADEAEYWTSQLTTQNLKAMFEGGEHSYAGWLDVPVWYIGTIDDHGLPVVAQRLNAGFAREMGASVVHRELKSSHSPFLSQPDETVAIMEEAVEAFTGKPLQSEVKEVRKPVGGEVVVRFWQPIAWYRFGLPLVFGHILGRGFMMYQGFTRLWRQS